MLVAEILLAALIVVLLPVCIVQPWIGALVYWGLSLASPHRIVGGVMYDAPLVKLIAAATLLGLWQRRRDLQLPRSREVYLLGALWVVFVASTLFTATHPQLAWDKLVEVSKILLMTGVTLVLFQEPRRLRLLLLVMALSLGTIGLAAGAWALWTRWPTILWGPPGSAIGDNNALGFALTMALPMLAYLRADEPRPWLRRLLLAAFGFSIIAVYATYSRGSLVGLVIVLAILAVRRRASDRALLAVIAVALAAVCLAPPQWWARTRTITPTAYADDASGSHRMRSWYVAARLGLDHPLLGAGFRPFDLQVYERYLPGTVDDHDAHNHFLQVFAEHGVPGVALFGALLVCTFLTLRGVGRRSRADPGTRAYATLADMVQVCLVAYVVGGAFHSMAYFELLYALIAVTVLLDLLSRHQAAAASLPRRDNADPAADEPLRVCVIAPAGPPHGGMSLQAATLVDLLVRDNIDARLLRTDPLPPRALRWVSSIRALRTALRTLQYGLALGPAVERAQVVHHFAASHLYFLLHSAPAILAAKLLRVRVVVNYRGGEAEAFLHRHGWWAVPLLRWADAVAVPSAFLQAVFARHGIAAALLPNGVDLDRFRFTARPRFRPRLIITRQLEPRYDVACALRAFRRLQEVHGDAALAIVGGGSEEGRLRALAAEWGLRNVVFHGPVAQRRLAELYGEHDICLNTSRTDNFPGSLVEAACCGLPIVTTSVGGIPYMLRDRVSAMLCRPGDDAQLADAVLDLLRHQDLAREIAATARRWSEQFAWSRVRPPLLALYGQPQADAERGFARAAGA